MTKISEDPRIDPRIKAVFGAIDLQGDGTVDVESREQLLERRRHRKLRLSDSLCRLFSMRLTLKR